MTSFKFVISEPTSKKSSQTEVDQSKAISLVGKKIGDEFNGDIIGLAGYTLKITGGSDKDGFPMHPSFHGMGRKRMLLSGPPGFYPKIKGERKRKTVRGDTISEYIVQVNVKVVKQGEKPFSELFPEKPKEEKPAEAPKPEPKKEEKKPEPKKEEAKPEKKPETKKEEKPKEEPKIEKKEEKAKETKPTEPKEEPKQQPKPQQQAKA